MRPPPPMNSAANQIRRTSVGSTSRYSANPPQTPAIFWSVRERVSFLAGLTGGCISVPHWEQKLTAWEYSFPHFGQNMAPPPFFRGEPIYIQLYAVGALEVPIERPPSSKLRFAP